jgi:hypothetical protein
MKQNGLKTSFGRFGKKAPGARIISSLSLPIDAEDYEYPYKIQVDLPVHIFEILSRESCTKKI